MAHQPGGRVVRLSGGARVGLAVQLFWALAVPFAYLSRSTAVQADDPKPAAQTAAQVEPLIEFLPLPTADEKRIATELEQPTTMDFHETPLQDVVDYLKDLHAIEIQIDHKALTDAGIDPESPATQSLKGVSLRSALHLLLASLELTTIIQDEVLLITSAEKASCMLVTRTYPVGDLVADGDHADLTDALTGTIKPQTWEEEGGSGRVVPVKSSKSLVISQTQELHDEVLQLLRSLRTARKHAAAVTSK